MNALRENVPEELQKLIFVQCEIELEVDVFALDDDYEGNIWGGDEEY